MDDSTAGKAFEFYAEHFDYLDPREPQLRESLINELSTQCPVTQSDAWNGFWVLNDYESVRTVCWDTKTFSSAPGKRIIPLTGRAMPPIDFDPPVLLDFRRILNPLLSSRRLAKLEPSVRAFVNELIDDFIEDGHCDLAAQFAKPFPGRMLYRYLFGIDDADVPIVKYWTEQILTNPNGPETPDSRQKWNQWIHKILEERRDQPARDDIIGGLLHGTVEGRPISDEEIVGCIENLILGGFSTTTDSINNAMLRMAERPELQARLRSQPELILMAIDEFLRYDSPLSGVARLCTRDTVLGGQAIKQGERVWMFFGAANRDQNEFDNADCLDIDRASNRHLAFGLGPHRCVGSNLARLNMRIALEELLARLGEFRLTPGETAQRVPSPAWGVDYLPLTFKPNQRFSK